MTKPFITIEQMILLRGSGEGVKGVSVNNHQLSLIAALLSIKYGKGGDRLKIMKGGLVKERFCFSVMKVLGHGPREFEDSLG